MVFAASAHSNTITSYSIENDSLVPYQIVSGETLAGGGFDPILLDGPEEVAVSPDGAFLAVACRSADSLLIFEIDTADALLLPVAVFTDGVDTVDGLNGASGVCFSSDSRDIYVTGYYDDAVSLCTYDAAAGIWSYTGSWDEADFPAAALHYPRGVAVSPDGTEVYICASGSDAFTVFSRDLTSGTLSLPASAVDGDDRNVGFDGIRRVVSAGNGGFIYAVCSNDNTTALFRRE
jgi:DNA-binding beta-propeller fold protein YncE